MNKKYIDFVPVKKTPAKTQGQMVRVKVTQQVETRQVTQQVDTQPIKTQPTIHKMPTEKKPVLGVVEDLNSHFIETDVPKRPLSEKPAIKAQVVEAKQQKVKARVLRPAVQEPVPTAVKSVEKPVEKSTYQPPKSPFINQNKVIKRPLSGNVYKNQITEAVKEEPKGPVTIIAKPEKDRHIGVIVTIIITIILGAAAGTVAFLLLPK